MKRIRKILNPPYSIRDIFYISATFLILITIPFTVVAVSQSREPKSRAVETSNLVSSSNFQPTAPFYATFFYPWYGNPNTDGSWDHWQENGYSPANNWASNYLPDIDPTRFNPNTELYSSNNDLVLYWQMKKMAEAKIEVAISSWWGPGDKTDKNFSHIIKNLMNNPRNTYPNLRWSIYYEKESYSNPSITTIMNDLNYIKTNYTNQPAMLKINGKPVLFVYGAGIDGPDMVNRWAEVRRLTNFYIVLQVFPGYENYQFRTDSWHQYDPTVRGAKHGNYSSHVSPGFWKYDQNPILKRDLNEFQAALKLLVLGDTQWKLIETWNEWLEGTAVEPGDEVIQIKTNVATINLSGTVFKNSYIQALSKFLPPLERGTGSIYDDSDSDGFNDFIENKIGTNSQKKCSTTQTQNDESEDSYPPDFNDDQAVTLADVVMMGSSYNKIAIQSEFNKRYDLNWDGSVDKRDLDIMSVYYNIRCQ